MIININLFLYLFYFYGYDVLTIENDMHSRTIIMVKIKYLTYGPYYWHYSGIVINPIL